MYILAVMLLSILIYKKIENMLHVIYKKRKNKRKIFRTAMNIVK